MAEVKKPAEKPQAKPQAEKTAEGVPPSVMDQLKAAKKEMMDAKKQYEDLRKKVSELEKAALEKTQTDASIKELLTQANKVGEYDPRGWKR